jgi:hypothetical protein
MPALDETWPCKSKLLTSPDSHVRHFTDENGVAHKGFAIVPGEKLCLLGTKSERSRLEVRVTDEPVSSGSANEQLISFELATVDIGSVLVVRNHFEEHLRYSAEMELPGKPGRHRTSSCPALPNLNGYEHWPHPIKELTLLDFRLLEPNERMNCE